MGKATLIKVDGTITELDHRPTLEEAQGLVGGYIELVRIRPYTLVVDEEGLLKKKQYNQKVKYFFGRDIVGDVIILEGWRTVG